MKNISLYLIPAIDVQYFLACFGQGNCLFHWDDRYEISLWPKALTNLIAKVWGEFMRLNE